MSLVWIQESSRIWGGYLIQESRVLFTFRILVETLVRECGPIVGPMNLMGPRKREIMIYKFGFLIDVSGCRSCFEESIDNNYRARH